MRPGMVGLQAEDHAFGLRIMNRGAFPGKIGKGKKPAAASGNGGRDLSHGGIGIFAPGLLLRQQYREQLITVPFGQSSAVVGACGKTIGTGNQVRARLNATARWGMARVINEKAGRTQLDHDGPGGENAAGNGFRSGIPSAGENFGAGQKAGSGGCFGRYRPYHICGQGDFRQLLWPAEQRFVPCRGRCHANPLARKEMCPADPALEAAADESIILTYWKLRDSARDDGPFSGLPARGLALLLAPAYRKAAVCRPEFDRTVRSCLEELTGLEAENCPSIDRTADTFARILQAAAPPSEDRSRDRALEQLLYHLGRWIYLIDARDDLEEDRASGCYNPVRARYGEGGDDQALALTLEHSLNLARSAFCVPDFGCRTPVLENILYLGLPMIQQAVFDGSWSRLKKEKIWRKPT